MIIGRKYRVTWSYNRAPGGWTNNAIYTIAQIIGRKIRFDGYLLWHKIDDVTLSDV